MLNDNKAIWLRSPSDVSEAEYDKFYKAISKVCTSRLPAAACSCMRLAQSGSHAAAICHSSCLLLGKSAQGNSAQELSSHAVCSASFLSAECSLHS